MMKQSTPDKVLDAGHSGCTNLIMEIFQAMKKLNPGETLEVRSDNEAADLDIAAWCHMTGHKIISSYSKSNPKRILIRKREVIDQSI
jgi:tRNA 2-thiouridine synthesizing protein A